MKTKKTRNNSVFINCPFDKSRIDNYLKPIIFCLVSNGLLPNLSLQKQDSGQLRINKIVKLMKDSKYSIHDLSLLKSDDVNKFARMNMPYELGIDYGLKLTKYNDKQFLVLGDKRYEYMKAISDINGFDISCYGNSTEKLFNCVRSWLYSLKLPITIAPHLSLFYDYIDFNAWLFDNFNNLYDEEIAKEQIKEIEIPEYIDKVTEYIKQKQSQSCNSNRI